MAGVSMYDVLLAPPGTKLRFRNKGGYPVEAGRACEAGLVPGNLYTLAAVEVGDSRSRVYLEEVPGGFNSVMFECGPYEEDYHDWMDQFLENYGLTGHE